MHFQWRDLVKATLSRWMMSVKGCSCMNHLHSSFSTRRCPGLPVTSKGPASTLLTLTKPLGLPNCHTWLWRWCSTSALWGTRHFLSLLVNSNIYVKGVYPEFWQICFKRAFFPYRIHKILGKKSWPLKTSILNHKLSFSVADGHCWEI